MADLDEYLYRAEQIVIWEQKANVAQMRDAFGISDIKAMKILLYLEDFGVIRESEVEGEYFVCRAKAVNANETNRSIHTLLNTAVRFMRDSKVVQKNDLEKFCIVLGVDEARVIELLETMKNLGVIEEEPMYRALSEEEVADKGANWYDPYESSVLLLDEEGTAPLVFRAGEEDSLYPEVEAFVVQEQKASPAMLQYRFKIGYARAARLIDALEANYVIGPADGAKPREVLKKKPKPDDKA